MTDKVIPSVRGDSNGYIVARIIEFAGGSKGWIQPSSSALLADNDPDLDQTVVPLNAFDIAATDTGSTPPDVTIDTGEAFVGGSWVARDTQTLVDLADNTAGQKIYIGWDHNASETMIIGTDSAFASQDPQLHVWTVDTSSGVVSATYDERSIGQQSDLGVVDIDDGSTIGQFLATAVADSANGALGDHNNELFRGPGNSSDLLMAVDDGSGALTLSYNAYFDGSWKFVVANERAYLLQFSADEIRLRTSNSATAAADDPITWVDVAVSGGNIYADDGTTIWNGTEVPQANLGGPSSSLSGYPLPPGDLVTGSGSGLDSDTVDGYEASELQGGTGEWSLLNSYSDTDTTTKFNVYPGTYNPAYDLYRFVWHYHGEGPDTYDHNEGRLRVGGSADGSTISTSSYYITSIAGGGTVTQTNKSRWENFGKIDQTETLDGMADLILRGQSTSTAAGKRHPTLAAQISSGTYDTYQFVNGTLKEDVPEITDMRFYTIEPAIGELRVYGRNL